MVACLKHVLAPGQLSGNRREVILLPEGQIAEVDDNIILANNFAPALDHDKVVIAPRGRPGLNLIILNQIFVQPVRITQHPATLVEYGEGKLGIDVSMKVHSPTI